MLESAFRGKPRTNCFNLSIQRKETAWESAFLSATRLSRLITAAFGQSRMTARVTSSLFLFLAVQRARRARRTQDGTRRDALQKRTELKCRLGEGSHDFFYHTCYR